MVYSDSLSGFFDMVDTYPDQYEIMQFTGLKDKNSKDIYEGDICKSKYDEVGEIKMGIGAEGEPADYMGSYYGWCFDKVGNDGTGFLDGDLTVIGNIYENPELIK